MAPLIKLVLEKGEEFDFVVERDPRVKEQYEKLLGRKFNNMSEVEKEIKNTRGYIPKATLIEMKSIPFSVTEWPVFYNNGVYDEWEIAKIRAIVN